MFSIVHYMYRYVYVPILNFIHMTIHLARFNEVKILIFQETLNQTKIDHEQSFDQQEEAHKLIIDSLHKW